MLSAHLATAGGIDTLEALLPPGAASYPALTPPLGAAFWYERVIHDRATPVWIERCRAQVGGVLDVLEAARDRRSRWWFGERLNHADIIVGCVLRVGSEAHPDGFDPVRWPGLAAHAAACEALPEFKAVVQPFHVTPPKG